VILGLINLRGEIVTLVDLRCRLGLPPAGSSAVRSESGQAMHVVVRIGDEIVSLSVDAVGEVVELRPDRFEEPPPTVAAPARDMIVAVCQVDDGLVQILDVATLLPAVDSAD
jgi:purine-binding chemotaxis protein CheW